MVQIWENSRWPPLSAILKFLKFGPYLEWTPKFFMIKNWFRTKKYSCKFSWKLIVKKLHTCIIFISMRKMICISIIINFCENLQEYFFVRNQFLIIKNLSVHSRYGPNLRKFKMADDGGHLEFLKSGPYLECTPKFFMNKNWFRTKKYSCKFSQKCLA